MKKAATKKPLKKSRPILPWQTGDYDRRLALNIILLYPFLLLCRLTDTTPETVLTDFMDNLAHASWRREDRDSAKAHLVAYFLAHGYGSHHYTEEDLRLIFRELDALGLLFPTGRDMELLDKYVAWRAAHFTAWFNRWFKKPRRKPVREENK